MHVRASCLRIQVVARCDGYMPRRERLDLIYLAPSSQVRARGVFFFGDSGCCSDVGAALSLGIQVVAQCDGYIVRGEQQSEC